MTATIEPTTTGYPGRPQQPRRRWVIVAVVGVIVAAGLGAGLGLSLGGSSKTAPAGSAAAYRYYQSVMGRYGPGAMMGGGYLGGQAGYGWMMGGVEAPGWMAGYSLPGYMMGSATDPGEVMGSLFADAPGARVGLDAAAGLAARVPAGATVDRAAKQITFSATSVSFSVVASPPGADDMFEVAGLVNPTIVVPAGAAVTVQFVNADTTSAHGLVISPTGSAVSWMPMATAHPAFAGAATWFLGDATSAGAHEASISFTAATAGSYQYICPVPGHAQKGMAGTFVVQG